MKAMSLTGVLAVALTFGSAIALAQTGPRVGDGSNSVTPPSMYNSGGAAAHVGDGTTSGQAPYSYNVGEGAAHVGDGSNSTTPLNNYAVANGSAAKAAKKDYSQGNAQSLMPSPGMAKDESSGK